ncbi:unnamed protein product [Effrenium voratum]|uniref:Sulfotransferase n=1 Tax=Effrenium voratum TaxID=2562239 RepID=A0AA36NAY2_9DINO|nr:unnamed protein product [Effrenium voratum]
MRHGWVFLVATAQSGHLLSWHVNSTRFIDVAVARAEDTRRGKGRLHFRQQVRTRRAASSVLAFRRLVRSQAASLPHLEVQVPDRGCVPRWHRFRAKPALPTAAYLLHVAKSGGTALRELLLQGPGQDAGVHAVRFQAKVPSESFRAAENATEFAAGRLRWAYEKRNALESGMGMVPGGENAWELQVPRLLRLLHERQRDQESVPCLCTLHFDFSLVHPLVQTMPSRVLGVAMFRDPVGRFLSHFYFARRLDWTHALHLRRLRPVQYLHHPTALLDTLMVWQDGMAGTAWLAGHSVHVGAGSTRREADDARLWALFRNRTAALQRAVQNFHRLTFAGLLEDLEGSMRLLKVALRWPRIPQMRQLNVGSAQRQSPEELQQIQNALRVLAPMDTWLYTYISGTFHHRLRALEADGPSCPAAESSKPSVRLPSEHELGGCVGSRDFLSCGAELFER